MAQAIRVDSRFATVHDTADTLGVSKARTNTLIQRAKRITSRIVHRHSGGEFATDALSKTQSKRARTSGRLNAGAKTYQNKSKKAKAKR